MKPKKRGVKAKRKWKSMERRKAVSDRKKFDNVLADLDKKFEPRLKAFRDSERITEDDLKIIINAKDY